MPFLRKPQLLPVKGINLSVPRTFLGDGFAFPQNLQYDRGELRKRAGRSALGQKTLGAHPVLHLTTQEVSTGALRLFQMTKRNIRRYNTISGAWDDLTGVDLTGVDTDFFSDCVVTELDVFLFTNKGVDNIRKYDGSGNTADLGGSPPKAYFMDYITPYVMLGNVTQGGNRLPTKVQWCDTGQPEVWSGGNSGSQLLSDDPSHIRQVKKLRDYAMVYKEKSVYRGRKVSTPSIFDFGGPFSSGKGLYSPRALASDGENHYYMGLFDFHINNGVRILDIGGPVREYLFNRLNRSRNETCHAVHVEKYKEVWFYVTVTGMDWPTEVWKYKYDLDLWYFDTCSNIITGASFKQIRTLTWDDVVGPWNDQTSFWDNSQGGAAAPLSVFGDDLGRSMILDETTAKDLDDDYEATLETKDYTGIEHKGIEYDSRWLQFDIWAAGTSAKLYYSTDYGSNWNLVGTNTLTTSVEKSTFWFDVIAKHIRFRIMIDGVLRSFSPYFLDAGEIK